MRKPVSARSAARLRPSANTRMPMASQYDASTGTASRTCSAARAVHDRARARFDLPRPLAGRDDERLYRRAASSRSGTTRACAATDSGTAGRAPCRPAPAAADVAAGAAARPSRSLICSRGKSARSRNAVHAITRSSAARRAGVRRARCRGRTAARMRTTFGSALVPVRMSRFSSSACTSFAGREVRRPSSSPAPCVATTGPTTHFSRICAERARTFASSFSDSMMSMTVSTIVAGHRPAAERRAERVES